MGNTMWRGGWALTTRKDEKLPEGVDQEDVRGSFRDALDKAAQAWYAENKELVVCEPDVF